MKENSPQTEKKRQRSEESTDVREKDWRKLKTKKERRKLLPPLSEGERDELRESIRKGYWDSDPIIVDQEGYIAEGHNRFDFCRELNVEPSLVEKEFESEQEVRQFIIKKHISRRNMNNFQKIELMKQYFELESDRREDETGGKDCQNFGNLSKRRVNEKIGDRIGLSRETVRKGRKILDEGSKELIRECRNGDKSIHSAYQEIKQRNKKTGGKGKSGKSKSGEEAKLDEPLTRTFGLSYFQRVKKKKRIFISKEESRPVEGLEVTLIGQKRSHFQVESVEEKDQVYEVELRGELK